jgi:hypothetical protein
MKNTKFTTGTIRAFDRKKAEETRTIEFIISDETRDRHGTVIPINAWKIDRFNNNGIVGYQHEVNGSWGGNSNPDQVLGIGFVFVEDGKLIGRVNFEPVEINPLAEKIFQKVLHGTLKATSVGFIETEKGKYGEKAEARDGENPTYYFKSVELLEFSIVNIPSNPNALRRSIETETDEPEISSRDLEETRQQLATAQMEIAARDLTIATLKQNIKIEKLNNGLKRS